MSFLSILKTIGADIGIGVKAVTPFAPAIETIPGFGSIFGLVFNAVVAVEGLVQTPGTGTLKKSAVTSIVQAAAPSTDPQALSPVIDGIVAALNGLQKLGAAAGAAK